MAAAAQDASEDDRSRRRKLPVIEGRLNISEGENLRNFIKTVPSGHYHAELTYLVLSAVSLQQIPKDICTLPNLTRLDCSENKLTTIPPEISKLVSLTHLDISKNQISNVPLCMLTMTALCTLSIKDNLLTELPQLNVLPNLAALKANRNHLHLGRLPPGLTTIMKSFGAQHVPSEIEPGLYLGSYISAQNLTVLQALHITHILTVARETPPAFPDKFEYRHIKEDDLPSVDLSKYFDEMAEYIARGKAAGGILVHCRQGISRSATAVAAYLIKKRGISYDGALDWLRTARQCVNPNSGFRKQLRNLYRECRRLRTPLLPGAPEAPVPEPIAEGDEESEQKEAKEVPEAKEKRDKKEKKERRSSREVKSEQVATETTAAAAQAPTGPVVVPELDIAADPRKKRSEERGSKIDRKDKEEREKKEKKEKEKKKEKKDKERKHKSGSQIDRKDRESTKDAKAPQPKADASVPPPTDFATSRSVEMSVDAPPPPRAPLAAEAAPQASLEGAMVLRKAIEEEVRAALRTELEAQVRREAELKLTEELMRREAVLRATIEAEIREQLAREMRPAHTALEMPSPTDTENDPLLAKPKEEEGVCSWCSIV